MITGTGDTEETRRIARFEAVAGRRGDDKAVSAR